MNDPVIKVENLSKSYLIGHQSQEKYLALRDVIARKAKTLGRRLMHPFNSSTGGVITADETEEFWALKDISFEVKRGDRVGIIGRNGAGKSTLLKILSRITEPTSGRVEIDGRVASLLEVGTGFHPELTGRENIYLNGAILGMSRIEVKRKFDEIVDFAEVEKFLDTPVKRYSSGMYVRLAFAVAAHLEPEILIVDEVLAVGDAQFQKKCLGKMKEVGKEGRTVLFVSHNLAAVQNLCFTGIYLENGSIMRKGGISDAISHYMSWNKDGNGGIINVPNRVGNGQLRFVRYQCLDKDGNVVNAFSSGEDAILEIFIKSSCNIIFESFHLSIGIDDQYGTRILYLSSDLGISNIASKNKFSNVLVKIPSLPLNVGEYFFTLFSKVDDEVCDWVQKAGSFNVEAGDFFKNGKVLPRGQGNFLIHHSMEFI